MKLFHTHVIMNGSLAVDEEGQTFTDLAAAKVEAERAARSITLASLAAERDAVNVELHIHDEAGVRLATLSASGTVRILWN
jgi:hypothetical protein